MVDINNSYQNELFEILAAFFKQATGFDPIDLEPIQFREDIIKGNESNIAANFKEAMNTHVPTLAQYYLNNKRTAYEQARLMSGLKLNLGGSSRFMTPQLDAVKKMILYSDTILIPDPILPWIESDRPEEKFRDVLLLENMFELLKLNTLVGEYPDQPPIVVFPSWEKTLEQQDKGTQEGIEGLIVSFISHFSNENFGSRDEVLEYARRNEGEFLRIVDDNQLFWAPETEAITNHKAGIAAYRESIKMWRSPDYIMRMESLSDGELIVNGIAERLLPIYHLLDNAETMDSQPLVCTAPHWHYYTRTALMLGKNLELHGLLSPKTTAIIKSLMDPNFNWLGNISFADLAVLRSNGENRDFRLRLNQYISHLGEASLEDIDRVALEVGSGIRSLIDEHQQEIQRIDSVYSKKYGISIAAGAISTAALFHPMLAPLIGIAGPLYQMGKFNYDMYQEGEARKKASKSLMGVLASAKKMG